MLNATKQFYKLLLWQKILTTRRSYKIVLVTEFLLLYNTYTIVGKIFVFITQVYYCDGKF